MAGIAPDLDPFLLCLNGCRLIVCAHWGDINGIVGGWLCECWGYPLLPVNHGTLVNPYQIYYHGKNKKVRIAAMAKNQTERSLSTKITTKGQITVPKPIREHLNLTKGDRIEFLIGPSGKVTLMPATADVRKLKGLVPKPKRPVTVNDMKRSIEAEGGTIK